MPGRGKPWKEGGTPDNTITSDDIKNATIVGADIDPTYRALIEGGGGGADVSDLIDPINEFFFYDEFFYPNPANEFDHYEKGVNSIFAPSGTFGGVVQYNSTASANGTTRVNICGAGMQIIDSSKKLRMKVRVKLISNTTNTAYATGFFDAGSDGPRGTFPFSNKTSRGLGFYSDGTGNWFAHTNDGSTPVNTDTGVTVDNNFHVFEIFFDPVGTPTITWKIDGVTVHTQTTNLPSFSGAWFSNGHTDGTFAVSIDLDSLFIYNKR